MIQLTPTKRPFREYDRMEARIRVWFFKHLYMPLLEMLDIPKSKIMNSLDDLHWALASGQVTFSRGAFRGKFSAKISKELKGLGAKWDKKTSSFKIMKADLPPPVIVSIDTSFIGFNNKLAKIDQHLSDIIPAEIVKSLKTADIFDASLFHVEKQFQKNVSKITVAPKLSDKQVKFLSDEWQANMDKWIKGYTEEQILKLREEVRKSVLAGNRYDALTKIIVKSFGETEKKAKFLARQETNLMMSKFNETRYTDAGIHEYKWGCVKMPHDKTPQQHTLGNVRYSHGILEGEIFRWDNPPEVTPPNSKKPRHENPGEDYGCRCFAIPVLRKPT